MATYFKFIGNKDKCKSLLPTARKFLHNAKTYMEVSGTDSIHNKHTLHDGSVISVSNSKLSGYDNQHSQVTIETSGIKKGRVLLYLQFSNDLGTGYYTSLDNTIPLEIPESFTIDGTQGQFYGEAGTWHPSNRNSKFFSNQNLFNFKNSFFNIGAGSLFGEVPIKTLYNSKYTLNIGIFLSGKPSIISNDKILINIPIVNSDGNSSSTYQYNIQTDGSSLLDNSTLTFIANEPECSPYNSGFFSNRGYDLIIPASSRGIIYKIEYFA